MHYRPRRPLRAARRPRGAGHAGSPARPTRRRSRACSPTARRCTPSAPCTARSSRAATVRRHARSPSPWRAPPTGTSSRPAIALHALQPGPVADRATSSARPRAVTGSYNWFYADRRAHRVPAVRAVPAPRAAAPRPTCPNWGTGRWDWQRLRPGDVTARVPRRQRAAEGDRPAARLPDQLEQQAGAGLARVATGTGSTGRCTARSGSSAGCGRRWRRGGEARPRRPRRHPRRRRHRRRARRGGPALAAARARARRRDPQLARGRRRRCAPGEAGAHRPRPRRRRDLRRVGGGRADGRLVRAARRARSTSPRSATS